MAKVAVLGAGAMGLAAAYHAAKAGHHVQVFEADKVPGGMAAHFDFDGLSIERFYHFICTNDHATFELCCELGIQDKLRWRDTSMGYFYQGEHYAWGDPLALLRFPKLGWVAKARYGLHMFAATKRSRWRELDQISAKDWFIKWSGRNAYEVLWRKLFELKFYEYADQISAAWIWSRIKRLGCSRKSILQERLGYLEGGSETLIKTLVERLTQLQVGLHLAEPAREVACEQGKVVGIRTDQQQYPFEHVISTVPTPLVARLIPALSVEASNAYDAIKNIGVVCVVLKLRQSVTRHFWVNVVDNDMEIPGFVEFSNLRPMDATVVYVPFYMPTTNPKFKQPDETFVSNCISYMRRLNPSLDDADLLAAKVGRLKHAQPVCDIGFLSKIPPIQTEIRGLQIADTCFYYPEDRGISESVRLGKQMASALR